MIGPNPLVVIVYAFATSATMLLICYLKGWGVEGVGTVCGLLGGFLGSILAFLTHD